MSNDSGDTGPAPLSQDELDAEGATALPDKEVISLLDLNAALDLALDAAAPVAGAVAANADVAAPIDAAVAPTSGRSGRRRRPSPTRTSSSSRTSTPRPRSTSIRHHAVAAS